MSLQSAAGGATYSGHTHGHVGPNATPLQLWLFSVSLANLVFAKSWAIVLQSGRNIAPFAFGASILDVVLLTLCIRGGMAVVRSSRSPLIRFAGHAAFGGLMLVFAHGIASILFADVVRPRNAVYAVGALLALGIVSSRHVRRGVRAVVLMVAPLVAITFGQALYRAATYNAEAWKQPALPAGQPRSIRLVWLVFDEWDYPLTFETKPVAMPAVQQLLSESFHGSRAHPPGPVTAISLPRLLTSDPSATVASLSNKPTVFSRAKELRIRSAAAGWYLPYCETFREFILACWSPDTNAERNGMGASFYESVVNQLQNLFETQFRSPFGMGVAAKKHAVDYRVVAAGAAQATAHPALDFVFVHYPIPHEPLFYDHATGRFDWSERPLISAVKKDFTKYLDATQLADKTIGDLRGGMQNAGLWDRTHLIVTSDHGYRNRHRIDGVQTDNRVPFLVRVAGAPEAVKFDGDFQTVLSSDLAIALLKGELKSTKEVKAWVESRAQSPMNVR